MHEHYPDAFRAEVLNGACNSLHLLQLFLLLFVDASLISTTDPIQACPQIDPWNLSQLRRCGRRVSR